MNKHVDINLIAKVAEEVRAILGDDEDNEALLDTLDGETDVLDIMDSFLASMQEDEALAEAAEKQAYAIVTRAKRIAARAAAKKKTLGLILDATGQKKVERPLATVSRIAGRYSVQITDEASIPSQLCKVVTTADKTAIKRQLEAGETVPGAELVRGPDTVMVRK